MVQTILLRINKKLSFLFLPAVLVAIIKITQVDEKIAQYIQSKNRGRSLLNSEILDRHDRSIPPELEDEEEKVRLAQQQLHVKFETTTEDNNNNFVDNINVDDNNNNNNVVENIVNNQTTDPEKLQFIQGMAKDYDYNDDENDPGVESESSSSSSESSSKTESEDKGDVKEATDEKEVSDPKENDSSDSSSSSSSEDDDMSEETRKRYHRRIRERHHRGRVGGDAPKSRDVTLPKCKMELVETFPKAINSKRFITSSPPMDLKSTIHAWLNLVDIAENKVEIFTQWGIYNVPGYGLKFYERLEKAANEEGIHIKIGYNPRVMNDTSVTPKDLRHENPRKIEERMIDIWGMIEGNSGVVHSKMVLTDRKHFYIGSANLGNRATTKTKEIGVYVRDCPVLGEDAGKVFDIYWSIYGRKSLPRSWPAEVSTNINAAAPVRIRNTEDDTDYDIFLSAGPKVMNGDGRSEDLEGILWAMDRAEKYILIAVNEYLPISVYKDGKYWPVIDNKIREVVTKKNVVVRFLLNDVATHKEDMKMYLRELLKLNTRHRTFIEVKFFKVSVKQFHGSHNKFMVTDKSGFIGTSNWTEDYFSTTAGQGFVFEPVVEASSRDEDSSDSRSKRSKNSNMREQLEQIFYRDWNSKLSYTFKP